MHLHCRRYNELHAVILFILYHHFEPLLHAHTQCQYTPFFIGQYENARISSANMHPYPGLVGSDGQMILYLTCTAKSSYPY